MSQLQELSARLTLSGLPEWTGLLALIAMLILAGCLLIMPFSVFGLKGRLDAIEAQLDELRADLRGLAMRMPEPRPSREWTAAPADDFAEPTAPRDVTPRAHPTLPPTGRTEPRISWQKR